MCAPRRLTRISMGLRTRAVIDALLRWWRRKFVSVPVLPDRPDSASAAASAVGAAGGNLPGGLQGPARPTGAAKAGDIDGTSKQQSRCVCMTGKMTEWPFEHGQTENVGQSDGCRGKGVPLTAESRYDFRELGACLGKVGLHRIRIRL